MAEITGRFFNKPDDLEAIEHVRKALESLGFDLQDENFIDTPQRFVRYLCEFNGGDTNPEEILRTGFTSERSEHGGMVIQHNIPWRTICPHHLLPVIGLCHLAYIPQKRVVGLSKLVRYVQAVAREKPRMQEQITDIIADGIHRELEPKGTAVIMSARHMCMEGRGVGVLNVPTTTNAIKGVFLTVPPAKDEFLSTLQIVGRSP